MDKKGMRGLIYLLGMLFSVSLIQIEALGKNPLYQTGWKHPDPTVTIVLRAPMSASPHLIVSSEAEGERDIKGLAVSLPRYTSIFFCVDQVNTVLYDIEIKTLGEKLETKKGLKPVDISKLMPPEKKGVSGKKGISAAWNELRKKIKDLDELNKALDSLLYRTEDPKFYEGGARKVKERFAKIRTDAKAATEKRFSQGTPQAICDDAEAAIRKVRDAAKKLGIEAALKLPKDLSDTSDGIAKAFRTVAEKLRAIETATWFKADTRTRILKEEIKYTCTFTPKEENSKLKTITHPVTITPTVGLSGILFTGGSFATTLRDDHYVSRGDKIALGGQPRFSVPLGGLVHAVICGKDFSRFSSAFAVSIGFGVGTGTKDEGLVLKGQPALGGSLLFSGPRGEGDRFAVTLGGIAKPVRRLNGYWVGDPYPNDPSQLTRTVYRGGWFIAITTNFNFILSRVLGSKKDASSDK